MGRQEKTPSWSDLLYEYTQNSTLHGIRYVFSTSFLISRRVIWTVCVTAAISAVLYLLVVRLDYYYTFPKSVNVDVTYETKLPFPAVTICNQNLFRLTAIQKAGLYDTFRDKFTVNNGNPALQIEGGPTCESSFNLVGAGCLNSDGVGKSEHSPKYVEVTLTSCYHLCQTVDDSICGVVVHMPARQMCIVTQWKALHDMLLPHGEVQSCSEVFVHKRNRCTDDSPIYCDFEEDDTSVPDCGFTQEEDDNEQWIKVSKGDRVIDHTTELGRGHFLHMFETPSRPGYLAKLSTPYRWTDGECIQFAFQMNVDVGLLSVFVLTEDLQQVMVVQIDGESITDAQGVTKLPYSWGKPWILVHRALPPGINRVYIEGRRSELSYPNSYFALDDISIKNCTEYTKNCKWTKSGAEYLGTGTADKSEAACLPWKDFNDDYSFVDGTDSRHADHNFCRVVVSDPHSRPFCLANNTYHMSYATLRRTCEDIPFCACRENWFSCSDGRCLPRRFLCDGTSDCSKGEDEDELCRDKNNIACKFTDDYKCGYTGLTLEHQLTWRREPTLRGSFFGMAGTHGVPAFMKINYGSADRGMRVSLVSPLQPVTEDSCLSFLYHLQLLDPGQSPASLEVFRAVTRSSLGLPGGYSIWKSPEPQTYQVSRVVLDIAAGVNVSLIFEASVSGVATDIIALADIQLVPGRCEGKGLPEDECEDKEFRCSNAACLSQDVACNGRKDCPDASDEWGPQCDAEKSVACDFNNPFACGYLGHTNFDGFGWVQTFAFNKPPFDTEPCLSEPCLNGGVCSKTSKGYSCSCPDEFAGSLCQYDIETRPCSSGPCQHGGNCLENGSGYMCQCTGGYLGLNCETDPCNSSPCQNGGTCVLDGQSMYCVCKHPYTGIYCDTDPLANCACNPCMNGGTCIAGTDYHTCACMDGFIGESCGLQAEHDPCISGPCFNNGVCSLEDRSFVCTCPIGYFGERCQLDKDPCLSNPCQNGGVCLQAHSGFSCKCSGAFYGDYCQTDTPVMTYNGYIYGLCSFPASRWQQLYNYCHQHYSGGPPKCGNTNCLTAPGSWYTDDDFYCVFPFTYQGKQYHQCLPTISGNRTWCATTDNYDKDKRYGYCTAAHGGVYTSSTGILSTPNYPGNYENNLDCTFLIKIDTTATITLTFHTYQMETCCDFLRVFDGDSVLSPVLGDKVTSSREVPDPMMSTGNAIFLHFHSDSSVTRKGFMASYTVQLKQEVDSVMAISPLGFSTTLPDFAIIFMQSPQIFLSEGHCMTFKLFTRGFFYILAGNNSVKEPTMAIPIGLGKAWHMCSIDVPAGQVSILLAMANMASPLGPGTTSRWGSGPFDLFLAAIDDIMLTPGNCSDIQGTTGTLACDFSNIDQCGYHDNTGNGPNKWIRGKLLDKFVMTAMAINGMGPSTGSGSSGQPGMNPGWSQFRAPVLRSAPIDVDNDTCIVITGLSKFLRVSMTIKLGDEVVGWIRSNSHQPAATQWKVSLPGARQSRLEIQLSEGVVFIDSIKILDPGDNINFTCTGESPAPFDAADYLEQLDGIRTDIPDQRPNPMMRNETGTGNMTTAVWSSESDMPFSGGSATFESSFTSAVMDTSSAETMGNENYSTDGPVGGSTEGPIGSSTDGLIDGNTDGSTGGSTDGSMGGSTETTDSPYTNGGTQVSDSGTTTISSTTTTSSSTTTSSTTTTSRTTTTIMAANPGQTATTPGASSIPAISAPTMNGPYSTTAYTVTRLSTYTTSTQPIVSSVSGTTPLVPKTDVVYQRPDTTMDLTDRLTQTSESINGSSILNDWETNLTTFYHEAGHQINDLIYRCLFEGKPCSEAGMTSRSIITDLGHCVSFNDDPINYTSTSKTGSGFGLSLVLNIEQYEYIEGPNTDAGIKVFLHEQKELPLIRELGFAVEPGVHGLVAAKYIQNLMLGPPYGSCGNLPLNLTTGLNYTYFRCRSECEALFTNASCGCIDAFMPGDIPICDLGTYLDCIVRKQQLEGSRPTDCTCPEACNVTTYASDLSYASLSTLSVNSLLSTGTGNLEKAYDNALEVRQRVQAKNLVSVIKGLKNIAIKFTNFWRVSHHDAEVTSDQVVKALKMLLNMTIGKDSWLQDVYGQGADQEFSRLFGVSFKRCDRILDKMESEMQNLIWIIDKGYQIDESDIEETILIQTYLNTVKRSLMIVAEKYTLLHNQTSGFSNIYSSNYRYMKYAGKYYHFKIPKLFRLWKNETRCDGEIVYLINDIRDYNSEPISKSNGNVTIPNMRQYRYENLIRKSKTSLECLRRYTETLRSSRKNVSRIVEEVWEMEADIQTGLYSFSKTFTSELAYIQKNIVLFEQLKDKYANNSMSMIDLVEQFDEEIGSRAETMMTRLRSKMVQGIISPLQDMILDIHFHMKKWYAKILDMSVKLQEFYTEGYIRDTVRKMEIWRNPEVDFDTSNILRFGLIQYEIDQKSFWQLGVSLEIFREHKFNTAMNLILNKYMEPLQRKLADTEAEIMEAQSKVVNSIDELDDKLKDFKQKSRIDRNFVLENFLRLDIYYAALRYEKVTQMRSYKAENYVSEIGGYMGLLIGASCLTLCEMLDLFLYNCIMKCVDQRDRLVRVGQKLSPTHTAKAKEANMPYVDS